MFSWGEDCQRGFRLKDGPGTCSTAEDGVHHLNLGYQIRDLSAGLNVLAFAKTNGGAFIIRTNENDGRRVRGKQKFVKCKEKFQAVSCGDDMVTLLSEGGRVYSVDTTRPPFNPSPLNTLSNIPVSQVACGSQHSMALTKEGQVYTWGQDSRGQLGLGKRRLGACSPQHLSSLSAIPLVQIAAGGEQSFALSFSGGVFGWGRNDCGQLGLGDTTDRHTPTSVHCLNLKKTVHISCGVDHTAILTKHGAVFTFGSGHYGQLGHNSFSHELRPRLVAELLGANVTQIACGRHHTLVLTDSKKVYSFGCREQGQLGHGEESHPSVPLPVQLPQDSGNVPKIRNIFAGGNCSFATCTPVEEVEAESNTDSVSNVTQQCLDDLIDKWTSQCDSKSWKKTKQEIHRTFSSASCVNKSFLELRKDKHFQTSPKYPGLNLSLARLAFKKLVKKDDVFAEVETAVMQLLQSIEKKPVGVEGLRIFLLLNELLHVIQKHKRQQSTKLAEAVAAAVLSLPDESIQGEMEEGGALTAVRSRAAGFTPSAPQQVYNLVTTGDWWSSLSASTMVKYVKVWKKALSVILSFKPVPRNSGIRNLLQVLQYMYNVNCRIAESRRMPDSDFCLLIDENFLLEDLQLWRSRSRLRSVHTEPLILCSFPIVMDLQSKKLVFDMNAEFTKIETVRGIIQDLFWEFIFFQPNPQHVYLVLDLRRASILDDTFEQLAAAQHNYFKRPLVVCFDAIRTIDAVHTKDFFYEVFHELLSAESGMFMFNDSETLAWFPSNPTREHQRYFLFGVLCGLALYSQCIIHLPFPMALFKKLLGVQPSLEDMMEFSPIVGQSLQYILEDYQDDDLKRLSMDFLIDWDGSKVGLDPENPEKPVTSQNKKAFVDAYVNHAFNTSVESVFQEFKRGFFQMCDRDLVKLFQPKELRKVLVGKDFHDWERLKQNTSYEGEYRVDHPNIQMFWEVFDELTEDQKKAFLWFVTGFERVPIHGLENIKMIVRPKPVGDLSNDQYYPETHTCFSGLELPLYSTQEIMKTKLTEALSNKRRSYK